MRTDLHFSSATAEWLTPPEILGLVYQVLVSVDLDPCANQGEPNVEALKHYRLPHFDGLHLEWAGRVFMNPPYGRAIAGWTGKLLEEVSAGRVPEAIALLPARVDTGWWHRLAREAGVVCFLDGRLRFLSSDRQAFNSAPFPSALVYLGRNHQTFTFYASMHGLCYRTVWPMPRLEVIGGGR